MTLIKREQIHYKASTRIRIKEINLDDRLKPRQTLDRGHIQELKEVLRTIDPIVIGLIGGGKAYYLVDGWHRLEAAQQAGWEEIIIKIEKFANFDEAYIRAVELNTVIKKNLSRQEKHSAFENIIKKKPGLSNRRLAEICGISQRFVSDRRKQMEKDGVIEPQPDRIGKDGQSYNTTEQQKDKPEPQESTGWGNENSFILHFASRTMINQFLKLVKIGNKKLQTKPDGDKTAYVVLMAMIDAYGTDPEPEEFDKPPFKLKPEDEKGLI